MKTDKLTDAFKKSRELLIDRDLIKTAIAQATNTRIAAVAELDEALQAVRTLEADAALVPAGTGDMRPARKRLVSARDAVEQADNRLAGLHHRLDQLVPKLKAAAADLTDAKSQWLGAEMEAVRPVFDAAIEGLRVAGQRLLLVAQTQHVQQSIVERGVILQTRGIDLWALCAGQQGSPDATTTRLTERIDEQRAIAGKLADALADKDVVLPAPSSLPTPKTETRPTLPVPVAMPVAPHPLSA